MIERMSCVLMYVVFLRSVCCQTVRESAVVWLWDPVRISTSERSAHKSYQYVTCATDMGPRSHADAACCCLHDIPVGHDTHHLPRWSRCFD